MAFAGFGAGFHDLLTDVAEPAGDEDFVMRAEIGTPEDLQARIGIAEGEAAIEHDDGVGFDRAELALIAERAIAHDAVVIADEVYEHIVFDGRPHISMYTLPGMAERTVKIGSAGKTFSLTGWKVGYITAHPDLLQPIVKAHQFLVFTTPPNLQAAVAYGLGKEEGYFTGLGVEMQRRRDRLAVGLSAAGLAVLPCQGTYFLNIDIQASGFNGGDEAFCRHLVQEIGVAAIPVSAFYAEAPETRVARFCFAKQDAVLDAAIEKIARAFR